MRVGQHVLDYTVAIKGIGIQNPVQQGVAFRIAHLVPEIPFLLVEEGFSVRDEQLEIARIGLVDSRIIDFIENPMAEREPYVAARVIRRPNSLLRAVCPSRLNPRRAKCMSRNAMPVACCHCTSKLASQPSDGKADLEQIRAPIWKVLLALF